MFTNHMLTLCDNMPQWFHHMLKYTLCVYESRHPVWFSSISTAHPWIKWCETAHPVFFTRATCVLCNKITTNKIFDLKSIFCLQLLFTLMTYLCGMCKRKYKQHKVQDVLPYIIPIYICNLTLYVLCVHLGVKKSPMYLYSLYLI